MSRRRGLVAAAAGILLAGPIVTVAQPAKLRRIGLLVPNDPNAEPIYAAAFRQGMLERGWIERQNIVIEYRFAQGNAERLPSLAADLVCLEVEVILTGSSSATRAVQGGHTNHPHRHGGKRQCAGRGARRQSGPAGWQHHRHDALGRPRDRRQTAATLMEAATAASTVTVLMNPANRSHPGYVQVLRIVARSHGVKLQIVEVKMPQHLDAAFATMTSGHDAALLVLSDLIFVGQHRRIAELATRDKLPAMFSQREFADAGGLAAYGPSLTDMFYRSAAMVDKILKGAKPGDLPVEQPTKFEFVINLKAARALGLTLPQSLLLRADEVIE